MKIIISAYSCETGRGSEGEIGWRIVCELARFHDVRVITRANLRSVHEASFAIQPKPAGLRFEYFDLPWIFRFYKKGKRFFLIYYYLWQIGSGLRVRQLLKAEPACVVHHLIGGMDWMPAGLALAPRGVPFVWGPIGSENTHPVIKRHLSSKSRLKDGARFAVRWALRSLEPFNRLTAARADVVLSHTPETLPARLTSKVRAFTQTGIEDDLSLAKPKMNLVRNGCLKLIFAGELKDWKGALIALEAALLAFERGVDGVLSIVGDGPLRSEMEKITNRHPNGTQIKFLGRLSMERLVTELYKADIFLYPSFHHGLSTIVLQAMLTKLPIICIEGDATGRAVGQEAGITVELSESHAPAVGVAGAIFELAQDDSRREACGIAARKLALESYCYPELAKQLVAVYRDVTEYETSKSTY